MSDPKFTGYNPPERKDAGEWSADYKSQKGELERIKTQQFNGPAKNSLVKTCALCRRCESESASVYGQSLFRCGVDEGIIHAGFRDSKRLLFQRAQNCPDFELEAFVVKKGASR